MGDALERAANGETTPEAGSNVALDNTGAIQPPAHGGDPVVEVDRNGLPVAPVAPAPAETPTDASTSGSDQATGANARAMLAATTQRSQELAADKRAFESEKAQWNANQQALLAQQQAEVTVTPPGPGAPVLFTDQLDPVVADGLNPEARGVLNQIGVIMDGREAKSQSEIAELRAQVNAQAQAQTAQAQAHNKQVVLADAEKHRQFYGADAMEQYGAAAIQKMAERPSMPFGEAWTIVAAPLIAQRAVLTANQENQIQKSASVLQGAPSPSAEPVPPAPADESSWQTAQRLFGQAALNNLQT